MFIDSLMGWIAAGLAARALAEQGVPQNGQQVTQGIVFSNIKIAGSVVDPSQFTPAPVYNVSAKPPTVTVFVQYNSTGILTLPQVSPSFQELPTETRRLPQSTRKCIL